MSKFITIEGPDGSGKSTLINNLAEHLTSIGHKVLVTREPGGIKISEQIRKVILDKENTEMDVITETLLYAAARRQHLVEKVLPALKDDTLVLCDRFVDSSIAYQGVGRDVGVDVVAKINSYAIDNCYPDITVYLDLEPEVGLKRIQSNNREMDRLDLEGLEFHKKVCNGFKDNLGKLNKNTKILIVDANKDAESVLDCVKEQLSKCL